MGSGRSKREQFHQRINQPAIKATLSVLEAAKKETKMRRSVVASSVYATLPFKSLTLQDLPGEKVYSARNADEAQAYAASKVNALNDSEQWVID